jgi:hypothetical protein
MSLLDTIKDLICKLMADKPGSEKENKTAEAAAPAPEVKPEPVAEVKPAPVVEKKPEPAPAKVKTKQKKNTNHKAEIEASMGPRPTDSALKRHYDAAVQAELDKY